MIDFLKGFYELIFKSKIKRGDNLISTWQFMLFSWLLIDLTIKLLATITTLILRLF